jgi:hypothetical protein
MSMKNVLQVLRFLWKIIGIAVLLLALLEILSAAIMTTAKDPRVNAECYADASWAQEYFQEFRDAPVQWHSFVYWRRSPFKGQFNIDARGIRSTAYVFDTVSSLPPKKIFMFGGSTMWGTGARDECTIPSFLQLELSKRGIHFESINFGESGYVSTQEVIALMLELQKGNVPLAAVFFDGVNDTFSAYQQGVAGLPQNEFNRALEFNLSTSDNNGQCLLVLLRGLRSVHLLQAVTRRLGIAIDANPVAKASTHAELEHLAEEVVDKYYANVRIVNALAQAYGFKALFYLQPTVFGKENLSEYEKKELEAAADYQQFFAMTHRVFTQRIERNESKNIHDLSSIFAPVKEPLYIDWMHVNERGNAILAHAMAEDILAASARVGSLEVRSNRHVN